MEFYEELEEMGACRSAIMWIVNNGYNLQQAWQNCDRADWMIWLLAEMVEEPDWPTKPEVIKLVCKLVRRGLSYVPTGEYRPRLAIEAAERWASRPTDKNVCNLRADVNKAGDAARASANNINTNDAIRASVNVAVYAVDGNAYDACNAIADVARAVWSNYSNYLPNDSKAIMACRAARDKELAIMGDIIRAEVNLEGIS